MVSMGLVYYVVNTVRKVRKVAKSKHFYRNFIPILLIYYGAVNVSLLSGNMVYEKIGRYVSVALIGYNLFKDFRRFVKKKQENK
ncbi:hypothetical protein PP175_29525 (plasmid) [Aneurinibacillus sp. Ricciae_BoGa-3]|uniref:hypothetical protein n=1 Tax=Aneurinibacillus sp. Ricciae_BoGa-3 TaxID=3022697 RepID=UPI0023423D6F|nr:hypothetical protein [Aneurinibacillus sp. Ricciae_BoGa-3]WCK57333.1 hypothetical protein PP175_29525 [Aneurinibacillus sp. Ricciae_BoGa-3]